MFMLLFYIQLKEFKDRNCQAPKTDKKFHKHSPIFTPLCSGIEPVDKVAAAREFRVLQAALHTSTAYRDSVG